MVANTTFRNHQTIEPKSAVLYIEKGFSALLHSDGICFDAAMCLCLEI